ncbi:hypothetical protein G9A89_007877 [Geosiphon pyriformis]|nr:hypothetical protein G9A89_007877 [Geosiphon pyriformis]
MKIYFHYHFFLVVYFIYTFFSLGAFADAVKVIKRQETPSTIVTFTTIVTTLPITLTQTPIVREPRGPEATTTTTLEIRPTPTTTSVITITTTQTLTNTETIATTTTTTTVTNTSGAQPTNSAIIWAGPWGFMIGGLLAAASAFVFLL